MKDIKNSAFSLSLLNWYDKYGRHDLPWQENRTAYRVWVSEIMLQQTQVSTVIPYFHRFIERFPHVKALAYASLDEVLALWSGLGYYSRARNLHKSAQIIQNEHQGIFPEDIQILIKLPGIGASTAAAITSQAFGMPHAILDANVKRVLSRYFLVEGDMSQSKVMRHLQELANLCMPLERCTDYTQAIMDFGALCCTVKSPSCSVCPLQTSCQAKIHDKVLNLPQKKNKKVIPRKEEHFLLFYNDEAEVYLEKRPEQGIWGGLWCLPNIPHTECPKEYLEITYGLKESTIQKILDLEHRFTHFHLTIHAWSIQMDKKYFIQQNPNTAWFSEQHISTLGLSKPVQSIIHFFYASYQD